ncbi:MAG: hypothetical protein HY779_05095 [Rubrobacteridae bacterium]|nr:hypothetical protein [Rubrobacteridae bacterium]
MATTNIVQIQIDPKTTRLSAAIHGILNATRMASSALPNETIKEIDVSNDCIRVKTTGNNFITMLDAGYQ